MSDTTLVTLRDGCEHHQEMADPAAAATEALRMVRPGGVGDVHGWVPARIESRGVPIWDFGQHDTFERFVQSLAAFIPGQPAPDPHDLEGWFKRTDPEEPYPASVEEPEVGLEGFGEDAPVLPEIPLEPDPSDGLPEMSAAEQMERAMERQYPAEHDSFELLGHPPEMSEEQMEEAMEREAGPPEFDEEAWLREKP